MDNQISSSFAFRPLADNDRPTWKRLWRDYLVFHETTLPSSIFKTFLERLTEENISNFNSLSTEAEKSPTGLARFLFHRHGWKKEDVCYPSDLDLCAERRGKGAGRKLIEAVYRAADAYGAPSVSWLTLGFNRPARQLYDRVGSLTPFITYERR